MSRERTKKTNLIRQDWYTTPPGFGAKQTLLTACEKGRKRRSRAVESVRYPIAKARGL